ncbi:ATPase AAA [Orpheovirus IHUMI-LCC2]|uniref:ATPase AAA n=1 Tax=Orpheovirus IHUMI-LCC2 TaxID=2023057 RepID=A0A2I2L617_9VIRU|nr:ATPase AAA [Orpheovirus IHUMI-LCC2]SNW62940.1 ATPase AAA [Orpheovirus IHUMI-LCC2]
MELTPSQREIHKEILSLLTESPFNAILIKSERGCGKTTIFSELEKTLKDYRFVWVTLELLHTKNRNGLSSQTFFDILIEEVRSEDPVVVVVDDLDSIEEIIGDTYSKNRGMVISGLRRVISLIVKHKRNKLLIGSSCSLQFSSLSNWWPLNIEYKIEDIQWILDKHLTLNINKSDLSKWILKLDKTQSLGTIIRIINYLNMKIGKLICGGEINVENILREQYQKQLSKIKGYDVIMADIPAIDPKYDLVGLEHIVEYIQESILGPLELNKLDQVPIKKGLIICGPPGTGKTTIGRWLSDKLLGRFYMIGGEMGVSGPELIDALDQTIDKAAQNPPGVIFIDDVDNIFTHDDSYRAFLTLLDGVANKNRSLVCIIATCNDITKLNLPLVRGGRLEHILQTSLPTNNDIKILVIQSIDRIKEICNLEIKESYYEIYKRFMGWSPADVRRWKDDVVRSMSYNPKQDILKVFNNKIDNIKKSYDIFTNGLDGINHSNSLVS